MSIREILYNCGFNSDLSLLKQKQPCVRVNLICPALDYGGGYGKSRISNLHIFAEKITSVIVSVAKEMPSFHGYGYNTESEFTTEKTLREYVEDVLKERLLAVQQDPLVMTNHPCLLDINNGI